MATGVVRGAPREQPQYRLRFGLAYVGLALVATAALGAAYVLADDEPARTSAAAWSGWAPEGQDLGTYPAQIAEHVASRYTLPEGGQLTGILAGPPVIQEVPLRAIDVVLADGVAESVPVEVTVMYTLCGSGGGCSIGNGEASEDRHRLVRRAVLELALHTFTHVEPVEAVVALLPPAREDTRSSAVLLRRSDVARELAQPLAATLAPEVPRPERLAAGPEGARVDALTRPRTFDWEVQQLQDGSVTMRLTPIDDELTVVA